METASTIPVLDLRDYHSSDDKRRQAFVRGVGESLKDVGFFGLIHHGIDQQLIRSGYQLSQAFFHLPLETKHKYYSKGLMGQRGYIPFGAEKAKDSTIADLKEFWHVGQVDHQGMDYPPNIWPSEELPDFEPTFTRFFTALEGCAQDILECCALFIGEDRHLISDYMKRGNSILRLLHYPAIAADAHPAAIRASAHEDINLITFLVDATASGLEILKRDGTWLPVVTPKDSIIIDSGDMLANMTNNFYKATTHRVVNPHNSKEERFSMPFFVHPRNECSLNPLPSCIKLTGGKVVHPNITAGDYLKKRLEELGLKTI